jgi:hypothetical protein
MQGPQFPAELTSFRPVTEETVHSLLCRINPQKATGSDGIPGALLLATADIIAPSLTQLFSTSLQTGVLPEAFTLASVSLLFKSSSPAVPTNYRPVSLLPIVSKLLEKLVQRQPISHLDAAHALPDIQFAFRKDHSTEDALVLVTDSLAAARDSGLSTAVCFLDMSKAFDKVKHAFLVEELFNVGITGQSLKWFCCYLSGRKQQVQTPHLKGPVCACSCGVPQGSVLGPILFSLYTRRVPQVVLPTPSVQFADDIELHESHRCPLEVASALSSSISRLSNWLGDRGLILNGSKSHVLNVSASAAAHQPGQVSCNGEPLAAVSNAKYLGVTLDDKLSFDCHVDKVVSKAACKIGALWRSRRCLSLQARTAYLKSVIMPDLLYGSNCFFASLSRHQLQRLQRLQNRAARAVYGVAPYISAQPLLRKLNLYRMEEIFRQKSLALVWRCLNKKSSPKLRHLLSVPTAARTRHGDGRGLLLPPAKHRSGKIRFAHAAVVHWNALPAQIRKVATLNEFKLACIPYTLM